MSKPEVQKPVSLNVEIPRDLGVTYANLALITHTPSEMIIDFAEMMPNIPSAKVCARIVMTPMNVKLLHQALDKNIKLFEQKYGEIKTHDQNVIIDPNRGFTQ